MPGQAFAGPGCTTATPSRECPIASRLAAPPCSSFARGAAQVARPRNVPSLRAPFSINAWSHRSEPAHSCWFGFLAVRLHAVCGTPFASQHAARGGEVECRQQQMALQLFSVVKGLRKSAGRAAGWVGRGALKFTVVGLTGAGRAAPAPGGVALGTHVWGGGAHSKSGRQRMVGNRLQAVTHKGADGIQSVKSRAPAQWQQGALARCARGKAWQQKGMVGDKGWRGGAGLSVRKMGSSQGILAMCLQV